MVLSRAKRRACHFETLPKPQQATLQELTKVVLSRAKRRACHFETFPKYLQATLQKLTQVVLSRAKRRACHFETLPKPQQATLQKLTQVVLSRAKRTPTTSIRFRNQQNTYTHYMEAYRSGHNGPHSKCGYRASGTRVRIPSLPPTSARLGVAQEKV